MNHNLDSIPPRLLDVVCSLRRYMKKTHLNLGLTFGEPWENSIS